MKTLRRNLEAISVPLVAVMTAAMGVVNVLSAVTPSLMERIRVLEAYAPLVVQRGGHLTSALAGFALLVLSRSLLRRKRVAWMLTAGTLLLSIPAHLLKGLDYEEASLAALLLLLLLALRPHFHARSDEPSVRAGLQLLLASLGFTLGYGMLGFYLLDRHYSVNFGFLAALQQTIIMFTQFYDPGLEPLTGFGRYFAGSIYLVGAATFGYALLMVLRPVLARPHAAADERGRAGEMARRYGRTALARLALLDDKSFFFSSGGSLISYVVQNHFAIALGDPIGPPEDLPAALEAYRELCASNDWQALFYQVLPDSMQVYEQGGMKLLTLGNEALVELADFSLEGSSNKNVRNAHSKMLRNGYRAEVIQPPYSRRMLRELQTISDDWLTARRMGEMRFSLGWFDPAYLETCPILLVRDKEGFIDGFANVITGFGPGMAAVDLMRHRRYAEKGIMDFLFVSLFEWAKEQGYGCFDLGLSALPGIGDRGGGAAVERTLQYIYDGISRFYNFRGLHAFKEKFHPTWSPRYLAYPGIADLPGAVTALIRVHAGR